MESLLIDAMLRPSLLFTSTAEIHRLLEHFYQQVDAEE